MDYIKIGNFYKDNLGRTNLVVRRVSSDLEISKYYKSDEQADGVFWELETIAWDIEHPHSGESRMNTYWKQAEYIRENYKLLKTNNTKKTMKITNLIEKILDKNTRTLIKAGFLSEDLQLTDLGASTILGLIFLERKEDLAKLAQEKIYAEQSETNR